MLPEGSYTCHTQQTSQMPIGPMPDVNPDDPLSATLTDSWNGQNPNPTVPVTRETKFGSLMRVLQPALEGGLIGWAGGKGHPGGGFGAANDFYMRQRAQQMQMAMLNRALVNDQFKNMLDYARTQHEINMPAVSRVPNAIRGKDANGNPIFMTMNPRTLQYEPVEGIQPDRVDNGKIENTDRGLVRIDSSGNATPVTMADAAPGPDGAAPTPLPTRAPTQFDSGSPRLPGTASQSPSGVAAVASRIPLHAPNFSTPRTTIRSSRNASGGETDAIYDENPNSPTFKQRLGSLGNYRAPLPDRTEGRQAQKTSLDAQIETYAAEALKQNGNDPNKAITYLNGLKNSDPDIQKSFSSILPKIRQRVRERTRQGKNRLLFTPQDMRDAGAIPTNQSGVIDEDENPDNE